MPRLYDPGGTSGASLRDESLRCAPPALAFPSLPTRRLPTTFPFSESNSAAHMLAVYASQPGLPSVATQDSLPAGGFTLAGREFNPLGHFNRFQSYLAT